MIKTLKAFTNLSTAQHGDCYKSHRLKAATLCVQHAGMYHIPSNYPIIHELNSSTTNAMRTGCENEHYIKYCSGKGKPRLSEHYFPVTILEVKAKDAI